MSSPTAHHHHDEIVIPKPLLIGAAVMVCVVVIFVGISSLTGFGKVAATPYTVSHSLPMIVVDEADGGVGIYDPDTREQIYVWAPGTGGFERTALRALATQRSKSGLGRDLPFELQRTDTNRYLLHDPSTQTTVSLNTFGEESVKIYDQLLAAN